MSKTRNKPDKKSDSEIWKLAYSSIENGDYIFVNHAKQRLKDRNVSDLEVLNILENKNDRKTKRNKSKDKYIDGKREWNYCIEGLDIDGEKIRIIISFNKDLMLVITVIRL